MRNRTLPIHPSTGLRAIFVSDRTGRVYWPILGGAEDGGDGGDGGGNGGGGAGGAGDGGGKTFTPPSSQEDLDRIINQAVGRTHAKYGMTPEEAKAAKDRAEALENDLASETEKAVKKAADDARAAALAESNPRAVRAEFRAAAKGVLSKEQLDALLEDLDLSKYVDDKGDVDEEKVEKKVKAFAPADSKDRKPPPRTLGQGDRPPAALKPGDSGRAMAQKRFGAKTA